MRILIVEDEKGICRFIKDGLQEEGFAVDTAADGLTGLELALTNEYDAILLDWMLPALSGIEICRQYRKQSGNAPIIFLTAKDTVQDTVFGLQAGANDYIKKPFQFEELLARIRVQTRDKACASNILELDDLTIDLDRHQVCRGAQEISLTPKEFSLLEFLVRNKDKVCTRTRIIEHVWDMNFDSDTSVIDVYINYLRKKLNLPGGKNYIKTVRGVGYKVQDRS
jgi:two-component system, OmpR family, copper resistance phosphate regulon response regulator CusR